MNGQMNLPSSSPGRRQLRLSPRVPKRSRTSGLQRIALPPGPNRPRSQGRPRWENDADPTIHHHWPKCQRHSTQCATLRLQGVHASAVQAQTIATQRNRHSVTGSNVNGTVRHVQHSDSTEFTQARPQPRRLERSGTGTACGDWRGLEAGTWLIMRPMCTSTAG